jgi:hypothetical protein
MNSFLHGLWHGFLTLVVFAVPIGLHLIPSTIGNLTVSAILILIYHWVERSLGLPETNP